MDRIAEPPRTNAAVVPQTGGNPPTISIVAWGSYDTGKPRVRTLLQALDARGLLSGEIHIPAWAGVEDKSTLSASGFIKAALRLLISYPRALLKASRSPRGTVFLLPYPSIPDIFLLWPLAALRGWTLVSDMFIPAYEAVVVDRRMSAPGSIVSGCIWWVERLAARLSDLILTDTREHSRYIVDEFDIPEGRVKEILVGAEPAFWDSRASMDHFCFPEETGIPADRPIVLFYGQLIPLHGIGTILSAVRLAADDPVHFVFVGKGQLEDEVRSFVAAGSPHNFSWIPWIDYSLLPGLIRRATVCLGIFGGGEKAARVIPNKVFQILAAGRPVITRESPAMQPLAARFPEAIATVPSEDPVALLDAVRRIVHARVPVAPVPASAREQLGPGMGVSALIEALIDLGRQDCRSK